MSHSFCPKDCISEKICNTTGSQRAGSHHKLMNCEWLDNTFLCDMGFQKSHLIFSYGLHFSLKQVCFTSYNFQRRYVLFLTAVVWELIVLLEPIWYGLVLEWHQWEMVESLRSGARSFRHWEHALSRLWYPLLAIRQYIVCITTARRFRNSGEIYLGAYLWAYVQERLTEKPGPTLKIVM